MPRSAPIALREPLFNGIFSVDSRQGYRPCDQTRREQSASGANNFILQRSAEECQQMPRLASSRLTHPFVIFVINEVKAGLSGATVSKMQRLLPARSGPSFGGMHLPSPGAWEQSLEVTGIEASVRKLVKLKNAYDTRPQSVSFINLFDRPDTVWAQTADARTLVFLFLVSQAFSIVAIRAPLAFRVSRNTNATSGPRALFRRTATNPLSLQKPIFPSGPRYLHRPVARCLISMCNLAER